MTEKLYDSNFQLNEKFRGIEMLMRQKGFDIPTAKLMARRLVYGLAQKESYIKAFSDIFFTLSVGLTLCFFLILLVRNVKDAGKNFELGE